MSGYGIAMSRYATFQGRASRAEYWWYLLGLTGIVLVTAVVDGTIFPKGSEQAGGLVGLIMLIHVLPTLAVSVRRLHDVEQSGWLVLVNLVPFGSLLLLYWACQPGTPGPNRYGEDPTVPAAVPERTALAPSARTGAATKAAVPGAPHDPIAELERLARLRASGDLSQSEFEVMKAQALSRGPGG